MIGARCAAGARRVRQRALGTLATACRIVAGDRASDPAIRLLCSVHSVIPTTYIFDYVMLLLIFYMRFPLFVMVFKYCSY